MTSIRTFAVLAVGTAMSLLCLRQGAVLNGFCPANRAFMTTEQRYLGAIRYQLRSLPPNSVTVYPDGTHPAHDPVFDSPGYASPTAFLKAFPECCAMVDRAEEGWRPGLFERLTGRTYGIVAVTHVDPYRYEKGMPQALTTDFVPVSACGEGHPSIDITSIL
jgi:hypothetical protein